MEPTIGLAFLAGFLSFISPCVLPLVPAYIGYMGGRLSHTVAARAAVGGSTAAQPQAAQRFITFLHGLAFVAGFTFIFVVLGLLATAFVVQIGRQNLSLVETLIARIGGLVVIFFGLHFMGVLPKLLNKILEQASQEPTPARKTNFMLLSAAFALVSGAIALWAFIDPLLALPVLVILGVWLVLGGAFTQPLSFWTRTVAQIQRALYSEVRMQMTARGQQSFASSAIMGVVFAAGWTPCIGPVYGAVLTMAANGGDVGQAGILLGAYSLGLGIPFLAAALLMDSAQTLLRRVQRHMHTVELVTGGFLVAIGVLVATGSLQQLSTTFANQFSEVSIRVETCGLGVAQGEIALGDLANCLNGDMETNEIPVAPVSGNTEAEQATSDENAELGTSLDSITSLADSSADSAVYGIERGNRAMNFEITTVSGEAMMLSDLRGKTVLVNFWATWCGPCRTEMPEFERVYNEYADEGFVVLAINNRESAEMVADFNEEIDLSYPLVLDEDGEIQSLYGVLQYPTTLLIDADGIIQERLVGPMNVEQIETLVRDVLT